MRLLVAGASGMLGSALTFEASRQGHEVTATYNKHTISVGNCRMVDLDICDAPRVNEVLRNAGVDVVINAAAVADVDLCEREPDLAHRVNVEGARNLAEASKRAGALMLQISTSYVFDGKGRSYRERDNPSPRTCYGKTKLEAEEAVLRISERFLVVRTAQFGWDHVVRTNFAGWAIGRLRAGEELPAFTDWHFTPIYAGLLSRILITLSKSGMSGVVHAGGPQRVSRFDFAKMLAKEFGLNEGLVVATDSSVAKLVDRPKDTSMDSSALLSKLKTGMPALPEQVRMLREDERPYLGSFHPAGR